MRTLITTCILIMSFNLIAQNNRSIIQQEEKIVYFKNTKGDSVRITARSIGLIKDTALLIVEIIRKNKAIAIQKFKTPYSFPLEISVTSFNNKTGILITYDPAVKNGNAILYLFNDATNRLQQVTGFRDLGMISTIIKGGRKYYYSYTSCGCADNCWKSIMFKIENYQVDKIASLSCDCENIIEKSLKRKKEISKSCNDFNNVQKFNKISAYWNAKIKNGL